VTEGTVVSRPTAPSYGLRTTPGAGTGRGTLSARRIDLLVAAISLLVFGWRFWAPSPWRDEAVTVDVTHRSWSEVAHLLGHVDLVHAAHYVLMKSLFGDPGLAQMRFVSVLAAAGTAVLLVRLGRAQSSTLLGAGSAAVFVALPLASRYAQEARSYATVTLLVTAATLALVHACRSESRIRWAAYGFLVVAAAVFHVFSVLVLPVHGIYVLAQARPTVLVRWIRTALLAGAALLPLAYLAFGQRQQVSWIPPTQNTALWLFIRDTFASPLLALTLVVAAAYLALCGRLSQVHVLGLAWVFLPAAQLYAISTQEPLFVLRYLAFTLPGAAIAIAAAAIAIGEDVAARRARRISRPPARLGTAWYRRIALGLAVAGTAATGLGMQIDVRGTGLGHTEDVRGAVELVDRVALPGDAVLFIPYDLRGIAQAYPEPFAGLDDVALRRTAVQTASLFGTDVREDTLERRLDGHQRVVVLVRPAPPVSKIDSVKLTALDEGFRQVSRMDAWPFQVMVFERRP
jgi:mannosyltransferase